MMDEFGREMIREHVKTYLEEMRKAEEEERIIRSALPAPSINADFPSRRRLLVYQCEHVISVLSQIALIAIAAALWLR